MANEKKTLSDFPKLVEEFHPTLNAGKTPVDFTYGTRKSVWWKCSKYPKHVWKTSVYNRTKVLNPTGCPDCAHQSSTSEIRIFTEVLAVFEDTIHRAKIGQRKTEVDVFIPSLNMGIEYDGAHFHNDLRDFKKNQLLNEMSVRLIRIRERPLKRIEPSDILVPANSRDVEKEVINEIFLKLSNEKLSREIRLKISNYLSHSDYSNTDLFREYIAYLPNPHPNKSLAKLHPKIAEQWDYVKNHPFKPEQFEPSTNRKFHWICKKGPDHKWSATPNNRTGKTRTGCPFCAKKQPSEGYNLATEYPDLLEEWDYAKNRLPPTNFLPKSRNTVFWICENQHSWEQSIFNRTQNISGGSCKICRSLAFLFPDLAKEWHPTKNTPLTPDDIFSGSGKKYWWACKNGHEWQASPNNRTRNGIISSCFQCKRDQWQREGWPMHKSKSSRT